MVPVALGVLNMRTHSVEFRWGTSRGRDTYGYNTCACRVDRQRLGLCNGGGYDMEGTALAEALVKLYKDRLLVLAKKNLCAAVSWREGEEWKTLRPEEKNGERLYGFWCELDKRGGKPIKVSMDGACGLESVRRLGEAMGLQLRYVAGKGDYKHYELIDHEPKRLPVRRLSRR